MFQYQEYDKQYLENRVEYRAIVCEAMDAQTAKSIGTLHTDSIMTTNADLEKITSTFDRILETTKRKLNELREAIRKVEKDNADFDKLFNEALQNNRAMKQNIRIVSYQYRDGFLIDAKKAIDTTVQALLSNPEEETLDTKIDTKEEDNKNPLYFGRGKTEKYLLEKTIEKLPNTNKKKIQHMLESSQSGQEQNKNRGKEKGASNSLQFFHYIRNTYYGEKQTIMITQDNIRSYQEKINIVKGLESEIETNIKRLIDRIKQERTKINTAITTGVVEPERQKRFIKIADSMSAIANFYITFYEYYQDLKLEQSFAAKAIIQKIYGFK